MRILLTGVSGRTAEPIVQTLSTAGHQLVGFDQLPPSPITEALLQRFVRGDIGHSDEIISAAAGCEAILHAAVAVGDNDYTQPEIPFATNVKGAYNIFETARRSNIGRVLLTSSAPVHLTHTNPVLDAQRPLPVSTGDDHLYDLTKRLQEEIGRSYSETFGLTTVILRLGHIVDGAQQTTLDGTPLAQLNYCRGGWVDRTDVAYACLQALTAPVKGYHALHIIGAYQADALYNIGRTEEILNMRFQYRFKNY
ncbi:MAG: NAD(P)-dependent oxidoreductase [Anaerolineales bacterium]|nr:NAD(P)-dependent oxidoreductase [Anaerolineales bacterium]